MSGILSANLRRMLIELNLGAIIQESRS